MVPFGHVARYVQASIGLAMGDSKALGRFNLSADGFYQSFQAVLFALPFTMLNWLSIAQSAQLGVTSGASPMALFFYSGLIDFGTWFAPLLAVFFAARSLGIGDRITAYIVTANWSGLLFTLFGWPPAAINLVLGRDPMDDTSGYQMILFLIALILSWRIQHMVLGRGALLTTGIFLFTFLISFIVLVAGQRWLFGL